MKSDGLKYNVEDRIIPCEYNRNMDLDGCSLEDAFGTDFVGGWAGESAELEAASKAGKRGGRKAPSAGAGCTRPETTAQASRKGERKRAAAGRADLEKYYTSGFSLLGNSSRSEEEAFEPVPENSAVHRLGAAVEGGAAVAAKDQASLTTDFADNLKKSLPSIQKMASRTSASLPASESGMPAYFGADPAGSTSSSQPKSKERELAPFIDYIDDEDTYNFDKADYTASFNAKGYDKAGGAPLQRKGQPLAKRGDFLVPIHASPSDQWNSEPALLDWKTKDKGLWSSQFEKSYLVPESTRETTAATRDVPAGERMELIKKMDAIYKRMDAMEAGAGAGAAGPNAQTETLLFVMSGLGLIFFLDLACRTAGRR